MGLNIDITIGQMSPGTVRTRKTNLKSSKSGIVR